MIRSSLRRHSLLFVILVAFVLTAFLYSLTTPFFEKTDEIYHFAYVKHLADGKGLPPPEPQNPARLASTHAPLYYLVSSVLIAGIDTDDVASLSRLNPYFRPVWDGVAGDNRNRYMHTGDEITPRRGAALAVRLLRCLSIAFGCVAVASTYFIAYTLFPDRRWLAAGAAAFCAFTPRFLYVSSTVNNDAITTAMCGLTGLASVHMMRTAQPRARHAVIVGVALSAALLSKFSAVTTVPLVALAMGYAAYRASAGAWRGLVRTSLQWGCIVLICVVAISGWWFIRNAILLDGDLTGSAVHVEKWGRRTELPSMDDVRLEIQGLEESYWAVFGLNSIPIDRWINVILFAVNRLAVAGGIALAIKQWTRWRFDRDTRFGLLVLAIWMLGSLASVLYWMYMIRGVNRGRLLYPALPAIALFIVLGPCQFTPRRWQPVVVGAFSVALCVLAVACPFVYIRPNYAPPPILREADVGPFTERLDANFQGQIVLQGYHVSLTGGDRTWPGDRLAITLTYEALVPFGIDYTVFVHLMDEWGNILVQQDTYTGMGRYPTTMWQSGEIIADTFYLVLPEWTPVPSTAIFEVGFYDRDTQLRLLVVDESGQVAGDSVWFHRISTAPPPGS